MLADTAEINEVLGREYDVGEGVDEADLDAELEALGEIGDAALPEAGVDSSVGLDAAAADADATAWSTPATAPAATAPAASYYATPAAPTAAPMAAAAQRPVATATRL